MCVIVKAERSEQGLGQATNSFSTLKKENFSQSQESQRRGQVLSESKVQLSVVLPVLEVVLRPQG